MIRLAHIFLIVVTALGLISCKAKRAATAEDWIYSELAAEAAIEQQLASGSTQALLSEAYSWKGVPYRHGGHSKSGTDCSGFVMEVFKTALGIELPRNSVKQSEMCKKIDKKELEPGDLVFFHPSKKGKISHVGLYVGDGYMIHASSRGVMVNGLDEPYYKKCFNHAGRLAQMAALRKKDKKKK